MHDDIISACIDASDNIPSTRNKNNKLPGWNEFVKREKETALFWAQHLDKQWFTETKLRG